MITVSSEFVSKIHLHEKFLKVTHGKFCAFVAVDGDWSTWSDWGPCDCDSLKQNRTSQCGAMFGGSCVGPPVGAEGEIQTELRDCVNNTCPGNTFCSENITNNYF